MIHRFGFPEVIRKNKYPALLVKIFRTNRRPAVEIIRPAPASTGDNQQERKTARGNRRKSIIFFLKNK